MKKFFIFYLFITQVSFAQLLTESFVGMNINQSLQGQGLWSTNNSVDKIIVTSGSLNYPGYPTSDGDKINYTTASNNQSLTRDLSSSQNSGSIYISFLIKVNSFTSTSASGDYILAMNYSTTHRPRFYIKRNDASSVLFGLSKDGSIVTFTTSSYTNNNTYLIVIKYVFNSATDTDDEVYLYINPTPITTEPDNADVSVSSGNDIQTISRILLRQITLSGIDIDLDEIRVGTSWEQAPLPVELSDFYSKIIKNKVMLFWQTETEINNYGFEIERKYSGPSDVIYSDWQKIGFVPGSGNSNSPKYYSFVDKNLANGYYTYRLKQIDYDGSYSYSDALKVKVEYKPEVLDIKNYPNPFNPITKIYYEIPEDGVVTLKIYNALGKEIKTLISDNKIAGAYEIDFDATGLPSGIYFNVLQSGDRRVIRKMQLIK